MNTKVEKGKLAIILGAVTFILFSIKPYLLDIIEPSKSIGQAIGENAKDIIDSINGNKTESSYSKRQTWSNILTISFFIFFTLSIIYSISAIQSGSNKWHGIIGSILSIAGLGIYFLHLSLGMIAFVVIIIAVVLVVVNNI